MANAELNFLQKNKNERWALVLPRGRCLPVSFLLHLFNPPYFSPAGPNFEISSLVGPGTHHVLQENAPFEISAEDRSTQPA